MIIIKFINLLTINSRPYKVHEILPRPRSEKAASVGQCKNKGRGFKLFVLVKCISIANFLHNYMYISS